MIRKTTYSETETIEFGQQLAQYLKNGDLIAFWGDLGSGKTHFTKGVCKGLNSDDEITSPSFTLINEYNGKFPIYHFDFYRIESENEIFGLGYEEYFYNDGICLVEWADRITKFLPENRIDIHLKAFFEPEQENVRDIRIEFIGEQIQNRNWDDLSTII